MDMLNMNMKLVYSLATLTVLCPMLYWAANTFDWFSAELPNAEPSALQQSLNTCSGIADKSVANLTAVVEFQKLEIAGRRVRVLQNCMNDQGFIENPAWVKATQPLTQTAAQTQNISLNEAYENLRRRDMEQLSTSQDAPVYWLAKPAQ